MKKKNIAILSIMILGLMFVGIAYAEWTDSITLHLLVNTGKLHLRPFVMNGYYSNDLGVPVDIYWNDHSTEVWELEDENEDRPKEWVVPSGTITAIEADNEFELRLYDVYPCLTATFKIGLENDETIPAGFHRIIPETALLEYKPLSGGSYQDLAVIPKNEYFSFSGDGSPRTYYVEIWPDDSAWTDPALYPICEILVELTEWHPDVSGPPYYPYPSPAPPHDWIQIDPDGKVYAEISIHFNENLLQDTEYKFYFQAEYRNWNEAAGLAGFSGFPGGP